MTDTGVADLCMMLFGFISLKCWFLFFLIYVCICQHSLSYCAFIIIPIAMYKNAIFFFSVSEFVFCVIFQYMTSAHPSLHTMHDYPLFLFLCLSTFFLISSFHIILLCFVTFLDFIFSNWFPGWRRGRIWLINF